MFEIYVIFIFVYILDARDQERLDDLLDQDSGTDSSNADSSASSSSDEESESDSGDSENDSESDEDDEENDNEVRNEGAFVGDVPLYENARITKMESIMMLLTLAMKFSLSGECLVRIMEIIELHCPIQNHCVRTLYMFKKVFRDIGRSILVLHYFCGRCFRSLRSKDTVCATCQNATEVAFFIEVPIIQQLQRLFLKDGFVESLSYRFRRQKKYENNIEDVYDGRLYKEQMENNGLLQDRNNISFLWYTDGISIFKSSKYSVWPLFLVINELSYKARTSRENVILAALWFGKSKPKPNLFLNPFRQFFQNFRTTGYQFRVPNGPPITVKGILLCGTCDLQAKGYFLRTKLSNGYHGCSKCVSRGERAQAGPRSTVHVHRYIRPENIQLRNNAEVPALAAQKAFGYKGLSVLYLLMPSMIRGTCIDGMHMLFLGLSKLLTKLWFDPSFSGQLYSCSGMTDVVNARLANIKPPSFIQRLTRTLKDLQLWKAKEYKLWFFYYSIIVLKDVLENVYLEHHVKLVSAISLLSMNSVSLDQIADADRLLHEYVRDFEHLYTVRYMGMNLHLCLHLADMVRDLGPLWVYSCFFFEDLNGQIIKLIHGPHQPGLQLCSSASLFLSLRTLIARLPPESAVRTLCENLSKVGSKFVTAEVISEKVMIIGKRAFDLNVPAATQQLLSQQMNIVNNHVQTFFSLRRKGVVFTCARKVSRLQRCSTYASFKRNNTMCLGIINEFVRVSECNCNRICLCLPANYYCIVNIYERIPWFVHNIPNSRVGHIAAVEPTNEWKVFTCEEIFSLCFYVESDNVKYIIHPINSLEYE